MQIIGFNFTKISAERKPDFKNTGVNTQIDFLDINKEKINFLKDAESLKVSFKFSVIYANQDKDNKIDEKEIQGQTIFEGSLILSVSKEENKLIQKSWKKKQMPPSLQIPLYNFILKKCTIKAVFLQDEVGLPNPLLKIPQLKAQPKQE